MQDYLPTKDPSCLFHVSGGGIPLQESSCLFHASEGGCHYCMCEGILTLVPFHLGTCSLACLDSFEASGVM